MNEKTFTQSILTLIFIFSLIPTILSSQTATTTTVYVNPQLTTTQIGETFSINISITQVTNLTAWEIKLYYLNTILNGTKATEGPFLKTAGSTFFWVLSLTDNYNATHGLIHLTCTLTGTGPGATGDGTLATITFKAKNGGNTPLTLTSTKLLDAQDPPQQIPHTTTDGTVQVIGIKDIAVLSVNPLKTIVGQGYTMQINVTVANQGDYMETFNVTLYANTTTIKTREITLTSLNSTTITFTWNTTGFVKGNYTLWAYAEPVQGETDTEDNTLTDGIVIVTIPGDVDGDHWVFLYDAVKLLSRYGAKEGDPQYDSLYDIDEDGRIFLYDAVILLAHYGERNP
jgi:hypothetical protein